jgi:hypothetical protein
MNYVVSRCKHTHAHKKGGKSSVQPAGGLNFEVLTFFKKSFYHVYSSLHNALNTFCVTVDTSDAQ